MLHHGFVTACYCHCCWSHRNGTDLSPHRLVAVQAHLDRIVAEAIDTSQQLIKKHVTLEKRIAQNVPVITADKRKVMQILYNLIGNAAKFTSKGSILVDVKLEPGGQEVPASALHVLLAYPL